MAPETGLCSEPYVGVCIAAHNARVRVSECLDALLNADYRNLLVVVVDDGSTDGTWGMLADEYPSIVRLRGDGDLWWTAANNRAVEACLDAGCDYVLLLNPDAVVTRDTLSALVNHAESSPKTIAAALVLDHDKPDVVWWAGSKWGTLAKWLPIWTNRYILKHGAPASVVPSQPYETSEAHGRGVLVPREVFDTIGLYDEKAFPHYGADVEFSFRASRAGISIAVVPLARVHLHTGSTGMATTASLRHAFPGYWRRLTSRKHGEALAVWWRLLRRYVPWYGLVTSYLFILALISYRYWTGCLLSAWRRHRQSASSPHTSIHLQ